MDMTVAEFAEHHGVDRNTANGTIKFLLTKGLITKVGERANPTGKGRSSVVYNVPESITIGS
jgi:predicted transcriptional regulator